MPDNLPLKNKHIMVTRPAHQAAQLLSLLEQAGASVYCQPLIEITPIAKPEAALKCIEALPQIDIAIFISQNAVSHGISLIKQHAALPQKLQLATVGLGSAQLLEQLAGRSVDIMPTDNYNSEGLLAHPALQKVEGKNIVIFRGIGGRNLLADTLRERGARVSYAEVYQRNCPHIDLQQLQDNWQNQPVDFISITSGEGMKNLVQVFEKNTHYKKLFADIRDTPLVIVNQRLQALAQQLGFTRPAIITENVSDKAIVDAIIKSLASN